MMPKKPSSAKVPSSKKTKTQLRNELKTVLFLLARESDNPGEDLRLTLQEVIGELHDLVVDTIDDATELARSKRPVLKLIQGGDEIPISSAV